MAEQLANRVWSALAVALPASSPGASESIVLTSTASFPATGTFTLLVEGEKIRVTANNIGTNTLTGLRGQEGTAADAHAIGKIATLVLSKESLLQLAKDILARIAVAAPMSVSIDGGTGNPTLILPAASGLSDGYMPAALWTKLNGIAAGAQVNLLELVNATAPMAVTGISGKQQTVSISPSSAAAAGSMSAAHFSLVNGATSAATGNALARRDVNGDLTVRYLMSQYLNSSADENRAEQPARLWGRTASDTFLRTFNPDWLTAGAAKGLTVGFPDKTKLDGIQTGGAGPDAAGWTYRMLPDGRRLYWRTWLNVAMPAAAEAVLLTFAAPDGFFFHLLSNIQWSCVAGNSQSIQFGMRYWNGSSSGGDPTNHTTAQIVARDRDGNNLNTRSTYVSIYLQAIY